MDEMPNAGEIIERLARECNGTTCMTYTGCVYKR